MLEVGGYYDAEDLAGPWRTFRGIERLAPGSDNHIAIGPWSHGGWSRSAAFRFWRGFQEGRDAAGRATSMNEPSGVAARTVAAALCKRARDWPWGSDAMVAPPRIPPVWLAHERLLDQLEAMTGARCYHELVATWEGEHY